MFGTSYIKGVIMGENIFMVGEQSPVGLGKVKKIIKNDKDKKHYIAILDSKQEVDIISDNLIVLTNL